MKYVVYEKETKIVKQILLEQPTEVQEDLLVATSDVLNLGDEVSNQITIHEVDEKGKITSYSAYKIAPGVRELLDEMSKKDTEIKTLKEQLSLAQQAIDDLIFSNGGAL